jgi:cation diffusion facilitator CzcD-associated flavoprotein CzcO
VKGRRVAIVGAGMAGIAAAIKLRDAGYDDVAVYEKGPSIGGTWRENTYPGVACDVPSHLYSYSFAPNPDWSHVFAPGPEIRDYLERVASERRVAGLVSFDNEVTSLERVNGRWRLTTARGESDEADVVIAATGVLHHPNVPDLPGLETFAGPAFHSARWDHGVPLAGARVGVVGTGSSAVQITTALAGTVGELVLFQRTAQWVLPVPNHPIPDEEKLRLRTDPQAIPARREELSKTFTEGFANAVVDAGSPQMKVLEDLCRANLEDNVSDPELRRKLTPSYRAACKRLIVSPNFYQAIQHPSARLVTEAIERVEPEGVRTADGRLHRLDVLVLATGFRVDRFIRPVRVAGRGGADLEEMWSPRPWAYLSVSVPSMPNLYLLNGPNGPVGNFSLIDVAELQIDYILPLVDVALSKGAEVCATFEAAQRFEAERVEAAKKTIWVTGCRSWYLDDRGVPAAWPWTMDRFREVMAEPRLDDFEVTPC